MVGNDEITTGCGDDLRKTTNVAYAMARQLVMTDKFFFSMSKDKLSDKMNQLIDLEASKIINVIP